ncbi:MAG: hypothetical protein WAK01_04625 [Methylocystis sp.]
MATEWVKLTEQDKKEPSVWINLTNAAILAEHKGGSRIWFTADTKGATIDVKEAPEDVLRKAGEI